jgi:shikimate dehydrogenase
MRKFGLIGYPLGHSFSKGYFSDKFQKDGLSNCIYETYPIENIKGFTKLILSEPELEGLNVTIPYKEHILPFLNELDVTAKEIGAVNTIKIKRIDNAPYLIGFNTDALGFYDSLQALILGTGGAAKAVAWVLKKMDIDFLFVSRNKKPGSRSITYSDITVQLIEDYHLLINTSPLGMYPAIDGCPDIPYDALSEKHILYDLIYNPPETLFLKKGAKKKAATLNGLPMLHIQAEKAWEFGINFSKLYMPFH